MRSYSLLCCLLFFQLTVSAQYSFNEFDISKYQASHPAELTVYNNRLIFSADDSLHGNELWISDGTWQGTRMLADINKPLYASSDPTGFTECNGKLYFSANDGVSGTELWVTDGTDTGTRMLMDIYPGNKDSRPADFCVLHNDVIFSATDSNGLQLWVTNGTIPGTTMLKKIYPHPLPQDGSLIRGLTAFNGLVYFLANDSAHGAELWVTNGAPGATYMLKDIEPKTGNGSFPGNFYVYNNRLYFTANTIAYGNELWVTNGTAGGTGMVKDIAAGTQMSAPKNLQVFNNLLYFSCVSQTFFPSQLYVTDGTEAGTKICPSPSGIGIFESYGVHNNKLYVRAGTTNALARLYMVNGSTSKLIPVKDTTGDTVSMVAFNKLSNTKSMVDLNGKLFFCGSGTFRKHQLYYLDNTDTIAHMIIPAPDCEKDALDPDRFFNGIVVYNNALFFPANYDVTSTELWSVTDLVAANVKTIAASSIKVYPNPAHDEVYIELSSNCTRVDIDVLDVTGRIITQTMQEHVSKATVGIASLSAGCYYLRVNADGKTGVSKIIKE